MQNASYNTIHCFKKLLIIFWGVWWLSALWTDVVGGLAYLNWLHADWAPSKNYPFLVESLQMYHLNHLVPALFFLGIIAWMSLICALYIVAIALMWIKKPFWQVTHLAFAVSLGLWMAFFVADQLIMNYDLEANHMIQAGFQLICWIFLLASFSQQSQEAKI